MNKELRFLLIEDNVPFADEVIQLLSVHHNIDRANSIKEAQDALKQNTFDVVIVDKILPDGNGTDLIPEIKKCHPSIVIIVLTADSNFNNINRCLSLGADDYVIKSESIVPELLIRIPRALSRIASEAQSAHLGSLFKDAFRYEMIGKSPAITELRATILGLKGSTAPVLITGESGTGKEVIARRINAVEGIPSRPFRAINCGAIPENLFESELFGHKRGAFTSAVSNKIGLFELAKGGDLFLDEVAELTLPNQTKLLRVLQEKEYSAVGSEKVLETDFRLIAATNKPLEEMVQNKTFREDLYYRLNVYRIDIDPLRKRSEDIPDLAKFLLLRIADQRFSLSEEAINYLCRQPWYGNIRELSNAVERAYINTKARRSTILERADFTNKGLTALAGKSTLDPGLQPPRTIADLTPERYKHFLHATEREFIRSALELCGKNTAEVALRLGLGLSTTYKKLHSLKITLNERGFNMDSSRDKSELNMN